MGYLGRRIGLSQDNGDSNPGAAGGAVGGGLLDLIAHGYFERQGDIYNAPGIAPSPMIATGGIISDYTDGSAVYRAHIFTSSGTFNVTALSSNTTNGDNIDFLAIGGGGSGGEGCGGGGGAGGYRTSMPDAPGGPGTSAESQVAGAVGNYAVTIGAGGAEGTAGTTSVGNPGGFSNVAFPTAIRSEGGGGGGFSGGSGSIGENGGSAGGGNYPGRSPQGELQIK